MTRRKPTWPWRAARWRTRGSCCAASRPRPRLEESTRLRRELGFLPGVASNLVGLAYIAAAQGRAGDAPALIAEGSQIAQAAGADRILRQFTEARAAISAA